MNTFNTYNDEYIPMLDLESLEFNTNTSEKESNSLLSLHSMFGDEQQSNETQRLSNSFQLSNDGPSLLNPLINSIPAHRDDQTTSHMSVDSGWNQRQMNRDSLPSSTTISEVSVKKESSDDDNESSTNVSTSNVETLQEREKRLKRERNRKSASKYRQKKKAKIVGLQKQLTTLTGELHEKSTRISTLESENKLLRQQLNFLQKLLTSAKENPVFASSGVALTLFALMFVVFPGVVDNPGALSTTAGVDLGSGPIPGFNIPQNHGRKLMCVYEDDHYTEIDKIDISLGDLGLPRNLDSEIDVEFENINIEEDSLAPFCLSASIPNISHSQDDPTLMCPSN